MGSQLLLLLAFIYAGLLFIVAWRAEKITRLSPNLQALIFSLSLAVYCSSWTFFGAVGRSAENGWAFLPIYLGPILLFVFGAKFLRRLLVVGSRNKVTSIADFIGSRYGKRQWLASIVTLVAVLGSLPYIALQLKAVALAWDTISTSVVSHYETAESTSLVTALIMAWFAIVFGTRVIDGPHRLRGMVTAVALESVVKLLAFVVLGCMAILWLGDDVVNKTLSNVPLSVGQIFNINSFTQTLLAMVAIVCLPRQFHVMVVEYQGGKDFRLARWLFPLYLLPIIVLVLPISAAGNLLFDGMGMGAEMYVLSLPIFYGEMNLAALVFIGGISAATGMVVVATVTLSIMISNEIFVPLWLRIGQRFSIQPRDLGNSLKHIRRVAIIFILLLGWLLEQFLAGNPALDALGLISFAAAAQLMPSIVAALYWHKGHRNGVIAGLFVGIAAWAYCLLLPALLGFSHQLISQGPMGLTWLAPQSLFGLSWLDPLSHGVFWSLLLNILAFIIVSKFSRFNALDHRQANAFTHLNYRQQFRQQDFELTELEIRQLQGVMDPLLGLERREQIWRGFEQRLGHRLLPHDRAPRFIVQEVESALAAVIGAVSAHRSVEILRRQKPLKIEDFALLVGGSSRQIQFSQELLSTTLESIPQGVSVVDRDMKLSAWNRRYRDMFNYPPRLLYVGCPIQKVYEFNAGRGYFGRVETDISHAVKKRIQLMKQGQAYRIERHLPDDRVIEINGTPVAGGGYVSTFTDITDYRRILDELGAAKTQLESRVEARTAELSQANISLQKENQLRAKLEVDLSAAYVSKNRFLAAASHDLLQPINAARLFVSVLQQKTLNPCFSSLKTDVDHIEGALSSAENLIGSLREVARLESGRLMPQRKPFALSVFFKALKQEFSVLAEERGVEFLCSDYSYWIKTDEQMLRRIVQNFLSNALRYTLKGRVLLGARYRGEKLFIEVWDNGPGIAEKDQKRVFEEFERLTVSENQELERGLGLGLSISQRLAIILGHELSMQSWPGKGSVFRVSVPLAATADEESPEEVISPISAELKGLKVLCIDNEQRILSGMQSLLEQWGCQVICACSLAEAIERTPISQAPDMILADYHLDYEENGLDVLQALEYHWQTPKKAIIISADNSDYLQEQVALKGYLYLPKPVQAAPLRNSMRALRRRLSST